ncbi:interleukin-31 receptor subunit alpha [Anolis carolinensis]|uniref:interleukin-31 receptor subunit alpha n=1 Tax=Anolis carolinensis TaxID=28377 RepID=UPI002F2B8F64
MYWFSLSTVFSFSELHGFSVQGSTQGNNVSPLHDAFSVIDSSDCDYSMCMLHPDWQDNLMCYYEEDDDLLYCSWLALPQTFLYTVVFKWNSVCEKMETTISSIERSWLYFHSQENLTVLVASNYSQENCRTTKKMSFIPSKTKKCPSPSMITAYQSFSELIIIWDSPEDILQYELQYKEVKLATSNWTSIPVVSGAFNATVSSVKLSSSYVARLRCVPKVESCSICVWSEEISIPHKLTEKPIILEDTVKMITQGKRSIFLKWMITQNRNTMGYHISIRRIPSYCTERTSLNITENWLYLNLSMAYYRINISAYNEAGESPAVTYLVPEFTKADLPGQINVSNHQNHTVVSWNLKYTLKRIVIDWGIGIENMDLVVISGRMKKETLGQLQPYQLYKVMLHAFHGPCEDFLKNEWTFGMTYFYAVEGVPRTGPSNVTIPVVTKHSALVKWTEIPAEESLGFLQAYRIHCIEIPKNVSLTMVVNSSTKQYLLTELNAKTVYRVHISGITSKGEGAHSRTQHFTTLKYDEGEFERMLAGLFLGTIVIITLFFIILYALVYKRSRKMCWPVVPNPRYSSAIQNMERTFPMALLGPDLQQLLSSQPCNRENKIYVEKNHSLRRQGYPSVDTATGEVLADQSEVVEMKNLEPNLSHLNKSDEINSRKKGHGALLTDYVGVALSHKAMQKFSESLSTREIHHLPSNLGRIAQPAAYAPQGFMKRLRGDEDSNTILKNQAEVGSESS